MADQEPEQDANVPEEVVAVPLEWHIPEGIVSRYASNILVQHTEHEFILYFFETRPPLLLGSEEEQRTALHGIQSVKAECFASIVVAAGRFPSFVDALKTNMERYRARFDQTTEGEQ